MRPPSFNETKIFFNYKKSSPGAQNAFDDDAAQKFHSTFAPEDAPRALSVTQDMEFTALIVHQAAYVHELAQRGLPKGATHGAKQTAARLNLREF